MQNGSEQLKRQQQILTALGFYDGDIDGIWSDRTIAAKKAWENSGRFIPAIPNNGLPFGNNDKYPRGVRREANGLLTCFEFEEWVENQQTQVRKTSEVKPAAQQAVDSGDAE